MAIELWKVGDLYSAKLTPPHGKGIRWETEAPVSREDLIGMLLSRGCHQTDIGDALHELIQSETGHVLLDP